MSETPTSGERWRERLLGLSPTCVAGFAATPVPPEEDGFWCATAFWLSCRCAAADSNCGRLLGHPLGEANPAFGGAGRFVGPLGYECGECGRVTEVIDTDRHGYHGVRGSSAVARGGGPRRAFVCPCCGREQFGPVVTFAYSPGALEAVAGRPAEEVKDHFTGFQAHGYCVGCGETAFVAGFEL